MKNILLILLVFITNVTFGQKFQKLEVNAGVSLFAPITKDVSWSDRAWGQRVQLVKPRNDKFAYVLNLGMQQSDKQIQLPVLMNLRHMIYKSIYITYGAGATFFKNDNTRFTLNAGWGVQMKKLIIEQSVFRTTAGDDRAIPHYNNLGVSVFYRL